MSALFMVSLPIDLRAFRHWAALRVGDIDEGRALHHLLSETFGKSSVQPFRLMVAPRGRRATLYGYTTDPEQSLRETARETGMPDALAIADPDRLQAKSMPETWRAGRRLAFDLRVRPVRRLLKPLEGWSREANRADPESSKRVAFAKGAEIDAYLVTRMRSHPDSPVSDPAPDRQSVYLDWLAERLAEAGELDRTRTRLVRFARNRIVRNAKGEGPDATFHGEFIVNDSAALNRLLGGGVGRHTAYGYGMMLLRPVGE